MKRQTYSFDDVLLVPQYSDIESRSEIDLSRTLGSCSLAMPIISSPMDTVTGLEMAAMFGEMGGLAVTHRYCDMVSLQSLGLRLFQHDYHESRSRSCHPP